MLALGQRSFPMSSDPWGKRGYRRHEVWIVSRAGRQGFVADIAATVGKPKTNFVATLSVAARDFEFLENVAEDLKQQGKPAKASAHYLLGAPVNVAVLSRIRSQQVGPQALAIEIMANAIRDSAPRGGRGIIVIVVVIKARDADGTRQNGQCG
jgi:hypothetical protein